MPSQIARSRIELDIICKLLLLEILYTFIFFSVRFRNINTPGVTQMEDIKKIINKLTFSLYNIIVSKSMYV